MNLTIESLLIDSIKRNGINHWTAKLLPNHYQYPSGSIRQTVVNGIAYHLDIHNWNDWEVYFHAQGHAIDKLISLCKTDDYIIDIGCNIGCVLMNMTSRIGPGGRAYGFEPNPITYKKLVSNLKLNTFPNITVTQAALGNMEGLVEPVNIVEDNLGRSIVKVTTNNKHDVTSPIFTLDSFCDRIKLSRLNIVKIDVEGYEQNVILGGLKTIEKFRPTLFIEISYENLTQQDSSPFEIIKLINQFGYSFVRANDNMVITPEYNFDKDCHFDIICYPN